MEVLFRTIFYYYWCTENRSLYRKRRYIEVRYIKVRMGVRYTEDFVIARFVL